MKNRVKEIRLKHELTQQDLADLVGVTSRTIISIEKEKYNPSLMLAYKLSLCLKIPIDELFDLEGELRNEENKK